MYRNTTFGSLPLGLSRRFLAQCCSLLACLTAVCGLALLGGLQARAQGTAGGGIQGTITDPSGARVRDAEVTATNTDTGVQTVRKSNDSGVYSIQPLQPGPYNVEVVAKGFERQLQENITVDNASMVGLNVKMTIGGNNETVTVTDAPPFLDTTDATTGGTIENELYSQLPLSMNGGPRDPTAFQYLMPGVQENPNNNSGTGTTQDIGTTASAGNSAISGGSGALNLTENYLEGVPISNAAQQGSTSPLGNAVSVDAVDQFSVQTGGASASFGGAGSANYTIRSGGNQFHGDVFDYIRNTMFDTWGYFSKVPSASTGFAVKPGEHQNNYGGTLAGPVLKDKLFFFGAYEGYHFTAISNTPQPITIPTVNDRQGNFTDIFGTVTPALSDPTNSPYGSRPFFQGLLNGVPTYNVVPGSCNGGTATGSFSSISCYLQQALPQPTNLSTFSNYLANLPQENSDYKLDVRIDYTLNAHNKFEVLGVGGNVGYGGEPFYTNQSQLPVPYAAGQYTNQKTASGVLSYTYIASNTLINSLKYGFSRNWGQGFSLTQGTKYNAAAAGITNLPAGNASNSMPVVNFSHGSGPNPEPSGWASNSSSGPQATNTYSIVDNLTWVKRRHNINFGVSMQWDESNGSQFGGFSKTLSLTYQDYDTQVSTATTVGNGAAYASFLIGAVYSATVTAQSIQDVGARYRPIEPYIQDNWQFSPKLTLNLGLRYSYLQPYHEVHDRISFLDVSRLNPIVGIPGVIEYGGFPNASTPALYAPYSCHCTTPVKPYNKNLQPRVSFAYAWTPSTVFSGAFSVNLTHAGGVGGGASATNGTGNSGEYQQATGYSQNGSTGVPAFFLNPSIQGTPTNAVYDPPCQGSQPQTLQGCPGTSPPIPCIQAGTCSPFSAVPPWTVPGVTVNPLVSTGNYNFTSVNMDHLNDYLCSTGDNITCNAQAVNYADPYYGGRGPQFVNYNFSMQKMINKKAVLNVAYFGSQTHFLPGGAGRGYATNAFSPDYIQQIKGGYSSGCSTGCTSPYPAGIQFTGSGATEAQSLKPFPQYSGLTDLWGETGNSAYNSLQVSVIQRPWHNLSGLVNYTRGKEIDDIGTHRTQFPVGPQDGNFVRSYGANQIDRALGATSQLNAFNLAWNYTLPIGRGQAFFATNHLMGIIGGGWEINGIYKYRDGYPLTITNGSGCMTNSVAGGTCLPDYTPGFDKHQIRINGRWGRGPGATAQNFTNINYINPAAFECADSSPSNLTYSCGSTTEPNTTFKLGNVARTAPYGLHGPGWWDIDMGVRRTFNVRETATLHLTFQIEADATNITNSTFYNTNGTTTSWGGIPSGYPGTTGFGTVSAQNKSILPRDWQFAGRFNF